MKFRLISRVVLLSSAMLAPLLCGSMARAGGYLWLGAEYQGEGNIYRYDIAAGVIDLMRSPTRPSGGLHWNNMATDCTFVYLGNPATQYLGKADIYTGIVGSSTNYVPSLSGHKEDGAYKASTGNLWRVSYSSSLHETTADGALVRSFSGGGSLVGLEWVGETLYATNFNGGAIGTLSLGGSTASFNPIPWAAGGNPGSNTDALAYDPQDDVLYLVAGGSRLYSVTFANGMATATLLKDLSTVGYPVGGLVDGMGWVPSEPPVLMGAVSRKSCDLPLNLSGAARTSEPRQGGISEVCFDYCGSAPLATVGIEEDVSCPSPPSYSPYSGASVASCAPVGNHLCCTFSPPLENARAYRLTVPSSSGLVAVQLRALMGDVNGDGLVNATDRSLVVGVWTGSGLNCTTDINSDSLTNATDRSMVVGAWTGMQNCSP